MSERSEVIRQGYRYALRPSSEQEEALARFTGAARFAFNWGLALVKDRLDARREDKEVQVPWSYYSLYCEWRRVRDDVAPWRRRVPYSAFLTGLEGVGRALQAFSSSRAGERKGQRIGFPRFRKRGRSRESCFFMHAELHPAGLRHVHIPRVGRVRSREPLRKLNRLLTNDPNARIVRATISREHGRWYVSFNVERSKKRRRIRQEQGVVGIDLGVRHLATLSTGETEDNPRALAGSLRRLRILQRRLDRQRRANNPANYLADGRVKQGARKWTASRRMQRTERRIQKLHRRVANVRRETAHQLTTRLTREYGVIGAESLAVANLLRGPVARGLSDAGLGQILSQLRYKTSWAGSRLVEADRFYPSSKTCSSCGTVRTKLPAEERVFRCRSPSCELVLDRDENAARNLAKVALNAVKVSNREHDYYLAGIGPERLNARGELVRPLFSGRGSVKREGPITGHSGSAMSRSRFQRESSQKRDGVLPRCI